MELKQCPFCGCPDPTQVSNAVVCPICGASTEDDETGSEQFDLSALEKWNKRHQES